jgi:Flp pilus assembly protein TadB
VPVLSVFFIVLITAFAVVGVCHRTSATDKQIHSRLASVDRKKPSSADSESTIRRGHHVSTIPALDKFLRNNRVAAGLCLLIEQCDLQWTIGRVAFTTLMAFCRSRYCGNGGLGLDCLVGAPAFDVGRWSLHISSPKAEAAVPACRPNSLPQAIDLMSGGLRAGLGGGRSHRGGG